jgi:tetratricopeptide (TPR) repeat protein
MRRAVFLLVFNLLLVLLFAAPLPAQIGKNIVVSANSPEDKALQAIGEAPDPAQKIALLDKFMADYGKGDMALAAYEQYIAVYASQKKYEQAFAIGDKVFAVDPDSFATALKLFQVAQDKKDAEKMFAYGERLQEIIARVRAQPAPAGVEASQWKKRQNESIADVKENVSYVQYTLFQLASQQPDPAHRAAFLERFGIGFSDSPYAANAQSLAASAYQQAKDYPKMQAFVQKVLTRDPSNVGMLLLLADDASERGIELDKAEENAHRALALLDKATKPDGIAAPSDAQWAQQKSVQQGLAWSSIGQVRLQRKQNAQAVEAFQTASPLLKSDNFSYARNQYRLGFALINLKRTAEARAAFAEAASVDSAYKSPAQEKLAGLSSAAPAKRPAKKRP